VNACDDSQRSATTANESWVALIGIAARRSRGLETTQLEDCRLGSTRTTTPKIGNHDNANHDTNRNESGGFGSRARRLLEVVDDLIDLVLDVLA
jgi:hypothetical protein